MQVDEKAELIATEARHHVFVAAYGRFDVVGEHLEQFIASVMAEAVVDPLEMVDV
ncbi:hypothetical protein D3C73_1589760 [compost metagenome]